MAVRECARRILELSREKEQLKIKRREAKDLRKKIVGVGNTEDSYGDKFLTIRNTSTSKSSGYNGSRFNKVPRKS